MENFSWYVTFIGRPNAGKSSLISKLTIVNPTIGRKPGSTRKINKYPLAKNFTIIDVPGWGKIHSRAPDYEERIKDDIIDFFETNHFQIPVCVLVIDTKSLIDVSTRLDKKGIIPVDQELYAFLKNLKKIPIVVFNKIDKISPVELEKVIQYFKHLVDYDALPEDFQEAFLSVSAKDGTNLPLLRDLIRKHLRNAGVEEFERYIKLK
ncbi:MAG: 50S ribosome-binding GTPase [Candidatus Heimdallarchaeota archaeon]|nr:50S ribosome-binding GTPase [Candidatus Heimdallarchaeota archaeon]